MASIAERRRQSGWIGQSRPRRTQVSRGRIQQLVDCLRSPQMLRRVERKLWPRAVSTRADRMAARSVSPVHPRTTPASHRWFPRATVRANSRMSAAAGHPPSAFRNIDGRTDVLQRIQHAQERGDRLDFGIVGIRADAHRCGAVLPDCSETPAFHRTPPPTPDP